jgi:phosphohistidine phosphatase
VNLYILRHGIAVDPGTPEYAADSERPLVPKGERKLRLIGKAMGCLELRFDLILSSPYLRARQTAETIAASLKFKKPIELSDSLTPGGSQRQLVEFLNQFKPVPQEVLLVGHEPYLSELISLLVSGESGVSIAVKKGGLCKVSAERLEFGRCATLEWLLTPKQMALMAGD